MHIGPTLYGGTSFALELENATFPSYDNIARCYLCKIPIFGCTFFIHYVSHGAVCSATSSYMQECVKVAGSHPVLVIALVIASE